MKVLLRRWAKKEKKKKDKKHQNQTDPYKSKLSILKMS